MNEIYIGKQVKVSNVVALQIGTSRIGTDNWIRMISLLQLPLMWLSLCACFVAIVVVFICVFTESFELFDFAY